MYGAMPESSHDIRTEISRSVRQIEPDAEVILFGSRARGSARPDSDWDVLILLDGKVALFREQLLFSLLSDIELATEEIFSVLIYEENYWQRVLKNSPLYQNVDREGVALR